jgi:sugar lactone lactonase YvrE
LCQQCHPDQLTPCRKEAGTLPLNRRQALTGLAATAAAAALAGPGTATASHSPQLFPTVFPLPDNWLPEGIAIGVLPFAYFGSRADGSIYRANLITGEGRPLPTPGPGTPSVGLKIDRLGRLFVAGGTGGNGRVVSALTGRILASYQFTTGDSFVNDVIVAGDAAYFTDTRNSVLYVVPLGRNGSLPDPSGFRTLQLPNLIGLNGISQTPDGRALIVIQSNPGLLFRVEKATGAAAQVDIGAQTLLNGDGLLLDGQTLYAVQNRLNQVAVLRMSDDGRSGAVLGRVTSPDFDVPTTVAKFGDRLYLPNARFGAVPPATTFTAVAIPVPRL